MNIKELGIQHVAIIMDGNGRWATEKNLHRTAGHAAGEPVSYTHLRAHET